MPARPLITVLKKLARYNGENGSCWDDPTNLERLNDVIELIYERGDFTGTMDWALYRVDAGFVTLPIEVEDVRGMYACHSKVTLQSEFYEFVSKDVACGYCVVRGGVTSIAYRKEAKKNPLFIVPVRPFNVEIHAENSEDWGAELVVEFRRGDLREKQTITLQDGGVMIDGNVSELLSVSKPITKGGLQAFIDYGTGRMVAGFWPAWSESPRYTRLRLINCSPTCQSVVAFCKKKARQLTDYNELVEIESLQALKFGYIALNKTESPQEYAANVQLMENALEKADANLTTSEPSEQIRPIYADRTGPH